MPCYEYRCPEGHTNTLRRPASLRDDPVTCEVCGQSSLREQIPKDGPALNLRGAFKGGIFSKSNPDQIIPGSAGASRRHWSRWG